MARAGVLSAWIVGMAGAIEGPVRALEHGHYFNTASSYLAFVMVPALLYAIGGMATGAALALLLYFLLRGRRVVATSVAAVSGMLVVFYWGSSLEDPFSPSASTAAAYVGMLALGIGVFLVTRATAARLAEAPPGRRRVAARMALSVSLVLLLLATGGMWMAFSARGAWGDRPAFSIDTPADPLSLLLITIDTLRADHVGCYGYPPDRSPRDDRLGTTPVIDGLADDGILFENAIVPEVVTDPSHASIMTSLYPPEHGVLENGQRLDGRFATLAEILSGAGYGTAAAVSVQHLDGYMSGLSQGFDAYYDRGFHDRFRYHTGWRGMPGSWKETAFAHTRPADGACLDAERWLRRKAEEPFFLWIHFFEPHMPYESHERPGEVFTYDEATELRDSDLEPTERIVGLYDSEIRYADDAVGWMLSLLRELGAEDDTIVLVISDHGEHMSEPRAGRENWFTHAEVYEEVCRVPVLLRVPEGVTPWRGGARAVEELVSTMDLGPTVLELLGVPDPRRGTAGRSLLPLLGGSGWAERPLVVLANPHAGLETRALRGARWKLLSRPGAPLELYDLERDPAETLDIADLQVSTRDSLRAVLDGITESWDRVTRSEPLDPQVQEMLRALGYLE